MATIDLAEGAPAREQRAERRRRRLHLPAANLDRVLAAVAAVLVPTGAVAVGLGWYGAAHTPFVFEQIPYLISGGLFGVGILAAGGMLYVGSWVARLAEQQRADAEQLRALVAELVLELRDRPAAAPTGAPLAVSDEGDDADEDGATVVLRPARLVATPTGSMFHTPDCSVVSDRDDLRVVRGDEDGMRPCKICSPTP